jgi:predicted porin
MKKVLMGTTALVAMGAWAVSPAAAAEEKIKIAVGGYYESVVSFVDQSFDNPAIDKHSDNVRQEGEIHFKGETTLDNGLTIGINVQLEAVTQADQLDEQYVYFSGEFGKVIVGAENSAAYLMGYSAPSVGLGVNSPNFFLFSPQSSAPTNNFVTSISDSNKLTYFSPRFSGFQLGLSYTPNKDVPGGDRQTFGLNNDNNVGDQANYLSVGLNFVNSFNGVDVAVSGTYERGNLEANAAGAFDDSTAYQVGANFGFSGFTVGGSYGVKNNGLSGSNDTTAYDLGVSYETGPWGVSVAWFHGEQELGGAVSDDKSDLIELGASYALGPGITITGSLQRYNEDSDFVNSNSDGWGAALQSKLSF